MAGRRRPLIKQELPSNQAKITRFFQKGPVQPSPGSSSSQPRVVNRIPLLVNQKETKAEKKQLPKRSWSDDEGDILDVKEVEPRPPSPKEVIDLISDDEDGGEKQTDSASLNNSNSATICPSEDSSVQIVQEMVEEPTNNQEANSATSNTGTDSVQSQENGEQKDDENYSSGDEILSQLDVEEIIRSSQSSAEMSENDSPVKVTSDEAYASLSTVSSVPDKENLQELSSSTSTSSTSISASLKSPRKVAKSKVNKFSPVRQFTKMKRTSSEASLKSPGSGSPSPLRKRSNMHTATANDNFDKRSPKKKLEFGPTPTSSQDNSSSQKSNGNTPYYLKNFMSILTDVMSDKFNEHLINTEDRQTVQRFVTLPLETQCLYIRLLQRKWEWKPMSKLNNKYKEIPEDVTKLCEELKRLSLFEQMSTNNATLDDVLSTLDLQKLTSLCKKLNVSTPKKTKEAFVKAILQKVKSQPTLTGGSGASQILKSALAELGPAFRITAHSKSFFSRLFLLHAPPQYWEVESDQTANQLLLLLLNNLGQMEYASYKINKQTDIFRNREDLVQFHDAFKLHCDLMSFTESKDWDDVVKITEEAKMKLNVILEDESTNSPRKHAATLPSYLRIYTAGSVLCHTCQMGLNGYQKLKMFAEANELLRMLLGQHDYLPRYRGRWWERISINSTHLKLSKLEAKALLEESLVDPDLKENHKLILSQRLVKINNSIALEEKRNAVKVTKQRNKRGKGRRRKGRLNESDTSISNDESTEDDELDEKCEAIPKPQKGALEMQNSIQCNPPRQQHQLFALKNEIPTRTITGEKIDRGPKMMGKSIFLGRPDANGCSSLVSVEQHAIDYYTKNEGYTTGIHGEGATVCSLYGLLFWEIIFYDELPDAFHNRYQPFPLDFHFSEFYSRRQTLIEEKLTLIRDVLSVEDLCGLIDDVWRENEKKMSIVAWSLFEDTQILKSLMRAMGTKMIAKICERLANNYRHYSSGFPDLVVWNEGTRKVLFVEVKGPDDRLSAKQELWLDFLIDNGINCEVCHIKAVSNKRFGRQN